MTDNTRNLIVSLSLAAFGIVCLIVDAFHPSAGLARGGDALIVAAVTAYGIQRVTTTAAKVVLPLAIALGMGGLGCATMKSAARHATAECLPAAVQAETQIAGTFLADKIAHPDSSAWDAAEGAALGTALAGALCWAEQFLDGCFAGKDGAAPGAACPVPEAAALAQTRAAALQTKAQARIATLNGAAAP